METATAVPETQYQSETISLSIDLFLSVIELFSASVKTKTEPQQDNSFAAEQFNFRNSWETAKRLKKFCRILR